jgi:hypothetical protein
MLFAEIRSRMIELFPRSTHDIKKCTGSYPIQMPGTRSLISFHLPAHEIIDSQKELWSRRWYDVICKPPLVDG